MFDFHRDAAEAAGFHVLRLIHEPAAALLAYNIGQDCSSGRRYINNVTCCLFCSCWIWLVLADVFKKG